MNRAEAKPAAAAAAAAVNSRQAAGKGGGFNPDAKYSFEEENERDEAVRKIQRSFRVHRARTLLRLMIRNNYVKLYDRENDMYFYKNKTTGQTSTTKPACLGAGDLDPPKQAKAPEGYDVGYIEGMPEGWFLGVYCSSFPRSGGRLRDLNPKTAAEKNALAELMPHDFICRLKPENVTMLEEPRSGEVLDTIERLGRIVTKKGFFVLYICTHVLTVVKGEPKTNPKENCYFATKDTAWGRPEDIASSSVSLSALIKRLNSLPCRRKSVIINYAHTPEPKKSLFASNRIVYPPPDFLSRLADGADCAVIGSCVTNNSMSDTLSHTASLATNKPRPKGKGTGKGGKSVKSEGASVEPQPEPEPEHEHEHENENEHEHDGAEEKYQESVHSDYSAHTGDGEGEGEGVGDGDGDGDGNEGEGGAHKHRHVDSAEEFFRMLDGKDHSHDGEHGLLRFLRGKLQSTAQAANAWTRMVDKYVEDWKVPPEAEIVRTPKPPKLRADWSKNEKTGQYDIRLPTSSEVMENRFQNLSWAVRRTLGPPVNFVREKLRALKKRTMRGPSQTSNMGMRQEPLFLFGSALADGLRGGAHRPEKRTVTVKMLFEHIEARMQRQCRALYEEALSAALELAAQEVKKANDERKFPDKEPEVVLDRKAVVASVDPASFNQNALFFVPKNNARAAKNPICIRCGPPAAPDRPYVVRTGVNEALLEWYSPAFDGVAAFKYQIEMQNKSRVFCDWRPINYTPEIRTTRFLVRELPSGVPCQFRISAFNNGGWSQDSPESVIVIPGEELTPLQTAGRWRKLAMGGPMAVMDKMRETPLNRLEVLLGLKRLSGFAQKANGFVKGSVQLRASAAALTALETFENDPEVARAAFLLVGWTLGGGPATVKVRQFLEQSKTFLPMTAQYLERFRLDSGIVNALSFVRKSMPAVPPPPVLVPPPDWDGNDDDDDGKKKKKDDELDFGDLSDSEDEGEDEAKAKAEAKTKTNIKDTRSAIGSYLNFTLGRSPHDIDRERDEAAAAAGPAVEPVPVGKGRKGGKKK